MNQMEETRERSPSNTGAGLLGTALAFALGPGASSLQEFFLQERRQKLRREKQVSYTQETECATEFNTTTGF